MMHENILHSARPSAVSGEAADKQARNRAYHLGRALDERAVAATTDDPAARSLHIQLAELHEAAARAAGARPA